MAARSVRSILLRLLITYLILEDKHAEDLIEGTKRSNESENTFRAGTAIHH